MEKKFIKNLLAKIILFICVTIILATLYYKILPILNAYGMQAFYIKDYTETKNFKEAYEHEIMSLESAVHWGIDLDSFDLNRFSYVNREENNAEYILDIELTNGKQMLLSNIDEDEKVIKENINNFRDSNRYYICKLNSNPETSEDYLKYTKFKADQSKFKKLDVYMRIENFEKPDYMQNRNNNYENFVNNYKKLLFLCEILLLISIFLIIYITRNVDNKKNFLDSMYFEEIIIGVYLVAKLGVTLMSGSTFLAQNLYNDYKYLIYFISYIFVFESYLLLVKRIKFKEIKENFLFPKIGKNMDGLYKVVGICILAMMVMFFYYNKNTLIYH